MFSPHLSRVDSLLIRLVDRHPLHPNSLHSPFENSKEILTPQHMQGHIHRRRFHLHHRRYLPIYEKWNTEALNKAVYTA